MNKTFYKVLNTDGSCLHGGSGRWFLPHDNRPGKWMPKIKGELELCANGYHILRSRDLLSWLGPAIFEVETRGKIIWGDDKGVCREARLLRRMDAWNEQTARLFACDCAESVVHLAKDARLSTAIRVARKFAFGLTSPNELAAAGAALTKRLFQYLKGEVDLDAIRRSVA